MPAKCIASGCDRILTGTEMLYGNLCLTHSQDAQIVGRSIDAQKRHNFIKKVSVRADICRSKIKELKAMRPNVSTRVNAQRSELIDYYEEALILLDDICHMY